VRHRKRKKALADLLRQLRWIHLRHSRILVPESQFNKIYRTTAARMSDGQKEATNVCPRISDVFEKALLDAFQ
jgi:hypothetical protein